MAQTLQEFFLKQCHLKMILDNSAKAFLRRPQMSTLSSVSSAAPEKNSRQSNLQYTARFVNFTDAF